MLTKQEILQAYESQKENAHKDYFEFLSIPSISTEPQHKQDVLRCAAWVKDHLDTLGFKTESWETPNHPVIFASWDKAGPNQPTLLIYNHYDVQPVDPLHEWHSPPFQPTIRDGEVYARGAQDNKGQCFYVLQALKILFEKEGKLPINVKLIIEGEEECGSVGLHTILKRHQKALAADFLAVVDVGLMNIQVPAMTLGIRGLITMDVVAQGSNTDMHSGSVGGVVFNPIHALVQLFDSVRDGSGKITIPGFYDDIEPLSHDEEKELALDFDDHAFFNDFGAHATGGEQNFSPLERAWLRPTFEINGINGGYTGEGVKTVIPAKATAKVSCRLVPNQDPQKVGKLVADYLQSHAPAGINITVNLHSGGPAVRVKSSSKLVQQVAKAYSDVFGKHCQYLQMGGSIPIVTDLAEVSGAEVVLIGLGLPGDKVHAPNEHFSLKRIEMGVQIIALALQNLAR